MLRKYKTKLGTIPRCATRMEKVHTRCYIEGCFPCSSEGKTRQNKGQSQNIKSGFRATGIIPFDPQHVLSKLSDTE